MAFKEIPISRANRLINHGPVILVTSHLGDRMNVMTAAWQMPVSFNPMLIAVAVGTGRFTHHLIKESGEFVVNVPHIGIAEKVWCCGSCSGKETDKFSLCGLTPVKAKKVGAPLIEECIGHIECRLHAAYSAGDHTIFVGEVLAASVQEDVFDERLKVELDSAKTIHHLGGKTFCRPGTVSSVEK
ncbi:MAG: flavin reductase family protein [Pseudomonadota bacterium]